jgi:UDP-N-acetylmuramoyl-tripeptide--D-alanyl-D-alanine ligase
VIFTAAEVARAAGGSIGQGPSEVRARGLSIDTRTLRPGQAFAAVVGARADAHDFVAEAAGAGAPFVIAQREVAVPEGTAVVLVEDTTQALAGLASYLRARESLAVVGVTGSTGKTTTKTLAAAALEAASSPGNLNTVYGLALALGNLPEGTGTAVMEMAISQPGEMAVLARMIRPDVMVLTNVAPVHTEFFGSMEELAREKASCLEGLAEGGAAAWNTDDPLLGPAVRQALPEGARTLPFGASEAAAVRLLAWQGKGLEGGRLAVGLPDGGEIPVDLRLPGRHNAFNAMAALAAGLLLGADPVAMAGRMALVEPVEGRGRILRMAGLTVIDESYNANPRAVEAALANLAAAEATRRIAVLGDMLELGDSAPSHHEEAGRAAARAGVDLLVGIGRQMARAVEAACEAGLDEAVHFETSEAAAGWLAAAWSPGDLVLVKGSRSIGTEKVIQALRASAESGGKGPCCGDGCRCAEGKGG